MRAITEGIAGLALPDGADAEIAGITCDSRDVRPGFLFAALPGRTVDGRDYIDAALRAGAVAVLAPADTVVPAGVMFLAAENPRLALAKIAAAFYGPVSLRCVAVTGTNGKSSVVHFCREIWRALGISGASVGTLGVVAHIRGGDDVVQAGRLTTPDPVTLHAAVADLAAKGVTHLAVEASSQGMAQYRLDGLSFQAAGFTNLTRDHLDDHGTMENYAAAKRRVFSGLPDAGACAVINADSDAGADMAGAAAVRGARVLSYGEKGRDLRLVARRPLPDGQFVVIEVEGARYDVTLPLVGGFQVENVLCALGLVLSDRAVDARAAVAALEKLPPVRGRLELAAQWPAGGAVYVDYAHTPDGLETMLSALRPHTPARLHVVFGCGGDRDRGKRPMMGAVAARLADVAIVTDDNPRGEDAAHIRQEIMAVCAGGVEIAGRGQAIMAALRGMSAGDVLVVAGKGHEQGQIVGDTVLPFDDAQEVRHAVARIQDEEQRKQKTNG